MKRNLLLTFTLLAVLLSACGLSETDIQATVVVAQSNAVATVHAQYTQIALLTPSVTPTLPATPTPLVTPTLAISPTATTAALGGGTTGGCDVMTFNSDVTVQDGEEIAAGTPFTKTWRITNSGSCAWTTAYTVVFASGDQMGGASGTPLSAAVAVGANADISVELTAPSTPGTYSGYWSIVNPAGTAFGSFYVEIEVP
jgi:hypothetical protein